MKTSSKKAEVEKNGLDGVQDVQLIPNDMVIIFLLFFIKLLPNEIIKYYFSRKKKQVYIYNHLFMCYIFVLSGLIALMISIHHKLEQLLIV